MNLKSFLYLDKIVKLFFKKANSIIFFKNIHRKNLYNIYEKYFKFRTHLYISFKKYRKSFVDLFQIIFINIIKLSRFFFNKNSWIFLKSKNMLIYFYNLTLLIWNEVTTNIFLQKIYIKRWVINVNNPSRIKIMFIILAK